MKTKKAFTLIELIFVIVIVGILSKFGVEFLSQAYKNFIFSSINNTLQASSATAVEFISTRLQHRIKDSVIAKKNDGTFEALAGSTLGANASILEWVGSDIDGYRGDKLPYWSGVLDLVNGDITTLISPQTDTASLDILIDILSNGNSSITDSALFFIGSNIDIENGFGWDGVAITDQNSSVMHPITNDLADVSKFIPSIGNFTDSDIYEYYKLAWSAYAISHEDWDADGDSDDLVLYYDYQPWNGDSYNDINTKKSLIMKNVDTFRFKAIGSIIKVQVCVKSNLTNEEYSICKEKTVF